jgi:hypothetical protein
VSYPIIYCTSSLLILCRSTSMNSFPTALPPEPIAEDTHKPRGPTATSQHLSAAKPLPTSCLICTEEFRGTVVPPAWITVACLHDPSVCTKCLAECIKSDLENKIWNQIKCPECKSLLIHEDIERLADPATFSRYVQLEFMRTKRFKLRSE